MLLVVHTVTAKLRQNVAGRSHCYGKITAQCCWSFTLLRQNYGKMLLVVHTVTAKLRQNVAGCSHSYGKITAKCCRNSSYGKITAKCCWSFTLLRQNYGKMLLVVHTVTANCMRCGGINTTEPSSLYACSTRTWS